MRGRRPSTNSGTGTTRDRWPIASGLTLVAALLAAVALPSAHASAADAIAIAGGPDSAYQRILGPRLRETLFPKFEIELKSEEDQTAALNAVANDRSVMAFSQRDGFVRYVRDTPRVAKSVEFYGQAPACLYFVIRKSGAVERYGDLADRVIGDGVTLDVGPVAGETAGSFAALIEADPALAKVRLEHRGGMRALSRVAGGQIDGALVVAAPGARDSLLDVAVANDALWVLPVSERDVFRDNRAPGFPFAFRRVAVGSGGWFGFGPEVETVCTEYGVVVNTAANPRLLEATAAAILGDSLTSSTSSAMSTAEGIVRWIVDAAVKLFHLAFALVLWAVDLVVGFVQALWDMRPFGRGAAVMPDGAPVRPARLAL